MLKGVNVDGWCYVCGHEEDSMGHLLIKCPFVRNVIPHLSAAAHEGLSDVMEWTQMLHDMLKNWSEDQIEGAVSLWYNSWFERNQRWQGKN